MTAHGSPSTYKNHLCRCPNCTAAWRDYIRDYTHRRGLHLPRETWLQKIRAEATERHGTESTYTHKRCRCDACRQTATEARQARRKATA